MRYVIRPLHVIEIIATLQCIDFVTCIFVDVCRRTHKIWHQGYGGRHVYGDLIIQYLYTECDGIERMPLTVLLVAYS